VQDKFQVKWSPEWSIPYRMYVGAGLLECRAEEEQSVDTEESRAFQKTVKECATERGEPGHRSLLCMVIVSGCQDVIAI
jgi:hypothetical protein